MLAPHQHAGAGHRDDIALRQRQAEIAGFVGRGEAERVARDAPRGEEHAGVLHLAVGIQQLRPDHRHLRPLHMFEQRVQPVRLHHLDVVVQEQQILARRRRHAAVVEMRPVERIRHRHDLVGVLLQPDLPRDLPVRNVVDADDLEVAIGGALAQRLDAGLDVAPRGAGRDDDRHHAGYRLRSPEAPGARCRAGQHLGRDAAPCRGARQRRRLQSPHRRSAACRAGTAGLAHGAPVPPAPRIAARHRIRRPAADRAALRRFGRAAPSRQTTVGRYSWSTAAGRARNPA